jgi:hypothetical protein
VSIGKQNMSCTICSQSLGTRFFLSALNEAFCGRHGTDPQCALCALPNPARSAGTAAGAYCVRCARGSVQTQDDVRRALPTIRQEIRHLGIVLNVRVQVRLVPPEDLQVQASGQVGLVHGMTVHSNGRVLHVQVASGLPPVQFGAVVAHEATHAWLVQKRAPLMSAPVEEGVCQLVAYAWLVRQRDPLASLVRDAIASSPDSTYGQGFRDARAAARKFRLAGVLRHVSEAGYFPAIDVTPQSAACGSDR